MLDWQVEQIFHQYGKPVHGLDTLSFLAAFVKVVLPYVQPFPGPRSVIVLDNSSLHHDHQGVLRELVEAQGGKLLFYQPSSHDGLPQISLPLWISAGDVCIVLC